MINLRKNFKYLWLEFNVQSSRSEGVKTVNLNPFDKLDRH